MITTCTSRSPQAASSRSIWAGPAAASDSWLNTAREPGAFASWLVNRSTIARSEAGSRRAA